MQPTFDEVNESHTLASGLPRQIEGVAKGDRRTPMGQVTGADRRAWQVPTAKDRPLTPVFTT